MAETLRENFETPSVDGVDVRLETTDKLVNLQLDKSDFENLTEKDVKEMWNNIDVNDVKNMAANIDLERAKQTLKVKGFTENEISETEKYLKEVKENPNQLENDLKNPGIPPAVLWVFGGPILAIYGAWYFDKKNTQSVDNEGSTDTTNDAESYEEKVRDMKEIINNSPATEDEKEVLISLIEGVEENKETFENVYEIVKKYKVQKLLEMPGEVQNLTKEVVEETSKYLLSEPKRIRNFVEKLHLPMDKKDILVSIMLSTILPALGLPLPVDPITVNSLYNSTTLLEEIGNRIKSDTRYVRDIAAKITGQIIDRIF